VWGGQSVFVEPDVEPSNTRQMKQTTEKNSYTLEWLYEDKSFEGGIKKWTNHKGKCKAVHQFMTMMSVAQYHNEP